jgi:hypothetical protein
VGKAYQLKVEDQITRYEFHMHGEETARFIDVVEVE